MINDKNEVLYDAGALAPYLAWLLWLLATVAVPVVNLIAPSAVHAAATALLVTMVTVVGSSIAYIATKLLIYWDDAKSCGLTVGQAVEKLGAEFVGQVSLHIMLGVNAWLLPWWLYSTFGHGWLPQPDGFDRLELYVGCSLSVVAVLLACIVIAALLYWRRSTTDTAEAPGWLGETQVGPLFTHDVGFWSAGQYDPRHDPATKQFHP